MKHKSIFPLIVLIALLIASCQNSRAGKFDIVENFETENLYQEEVVLNYRELYGGDGDALMDAILSDNFVLYEDPENTFSVILIDVPTVDELDLPDFSISTAVTALGTVESMDKGIFHHSVAYFKFNDLADIIEDTPSEMAHWSVPNFEPAHNRLRFLMNDIEGDEFWFFAPVTEGSENGVHARVRTIIENDYIYVLRLIGTEEAIFGPEGDKFFGSFSLND